MIKTYFIKAGTEVGYHTVGDGRDRWAQKLTDLDVTYTGDDLDDGYSHLHKIDGPSAVRVFCLPPSTTLVDKIWCMNKNMTINSL